MSHIPWYSAWFCSYRSRYYWRAKRCPVIRTQPDVGVVNKNFYHLLENYPLTVRSFHLPESSYNLSTAVDKFHYHLPVSQQVKLDLEVVATNSTTMVRQEPNTRILLDIQKNNGNYSWMLLVMKDVGSQPIGQKHNL